VGPGIRRDPARVWARSWRECDARLHEHGHQHHCPLAWTNEPQAGGQRAGKKVEYQYEDIEAIRDEVPLVKAVSGEIDRDFGFKVGTRVVSMNVRGVELPYGQMRRIDIEDGRYFNEGDFVDHRRVVILGYNAAKKVFQGAPAVGQFVNLGGLEFEVIGTMRNKIQDSMYQGPDNENGFIPMGLFRDLKNIRDPEMIVFQPMAPELNKKTLAAVREVIARRHHFDPKDEKLLLKWMRSKARRW
jgi:putative ABC transport system permease protein